jgi:hypothetical protein
MFIRKCLMLVEENRPVYILLLSGITAAGLGSFWYHLAPDNQTLFWDRLPMTVALMALFSVIISEYISVRWGKRLLYPLLIVGVLSVVYWNMTEARGRGDLRLYALVQFLPLVIIPVTLLMYNPGLRVRTGIGCCWRPISWPRHWNTGMMRCIPCWFS